MIERPKSYCATSDWTLIVSDNGFGKAKGDKPKPMNGCLGTTIVATLAKQLNAVVSMRSSSTGFSYIAASKAAAKRVLRCLMRCINFRELGKFFVIPVFEV